MGLPSHQPHAVMLVQDNLLPVSCSGKNWQGGIGLTLIDALDTLVLLNRRADLEVAVQQIRQHVSFDLNEKVGH